MTDTATATPARRVFRYGDHTFDDPGEAYTPEQVRLHLVQYFPDLAHAETDEKELPDGTLEVVFQKRVARKGAAPAAVLAALETVPSYEDPLAEVAAALGPPPLTLAQLLAARGRLQAQSSQVYDLSNRTAKVVTRCLNLPPPPRDTSRPDSKTRPAGNFARLPAPAGHRRPRPGAPAGSGDPGHPLPPALPPPDRLAGGALQLDAEETFASMTETFLGRVEEHLFPVMTEVWEEGVEDVLYSLNQICIIPQGLEHWYYDQFDDYREPVALLLHIEHNYEDDEGGTTLSRVYPNLSLPLDLDLDLVRARLEGMTLSPPLDGLVEAIHMVRHSADNIWMDYSMSDIAEMGYHLAWDDEETVEWLKESWQEAAPRLERVWQLVDWCCPRSVSVPDPNAFEQVVTLLLDAHRMEKIDHE